MITICLLLVAFSPKPVSGCPSNCYCDPSIMVCSRGKGIPRAPPNTTTVELRRMDIGYITRNMMANLQYRNLTSLKLLDNAISGISPDAFEDLHFLKALEWQQPLLPLQDILLALNNMKSNLEGLIIKGNGGPIKTIDAVVFQHLTSLRNLALTVEELEVFNGTALSQTYNLSQLKLSENRINSFILESPLQNLIHLNLDGNNLVAIPPLCGDRGVPLMPLLRMLNLQDNAIRRLDVTSIICLKKLNKLILSQNRIEHLPDNGFSNLPNLQSLNIANLWALKSVGSLAFNSTSLYKLYYVNNPPFTGARAILENAFKFTPNLGMLQFSFTKLNIAGKSLKLFLLSLKNLEFLTMQYAGLNDLPSDVFSTLKKLRVLNLLGNKLSNLTSGVFANVTSIRKLTLASCNIKIIKEDTFPLEFRLSFKQIDLSGNPFLCSCDLLWFRTWMKEVIANESIVFSNYPSNYECTSSSGKRLRLADFNPTEKSCTTVKLYTVILTIVLSVCFMVTVTALVVYRYRWYLRYWISLLRRRRQRQHQRQSEDMKYDAFVSYSNEDGGWVHGQLLNFLEEEVGLRLCEHTRDFVPGKFIIDNVIEAMDTSRKTILVISNEYMQSDWCKFELQLALYSFLKCEIDIVVILLDHIKTCHVTSALRALMMSTTFIRWHDEAEAKELFKGRVRNILCEGDIVGRAGEGNHADDDLLIP
ncbi:toll-like receptor 13 [Haliotis rufescens]|uniref:toll-like receptor 13 n=1 Tax=Haliotis rufescens TaxID=6454 RepID=UPI00201F58E6|nr:toll-like receptor 13 [Haliotis rufescens]XP_046380257.2 toll-like receptor 13 [Haliotis rufescens]XP_048243048.1 toll-like receptor 13 [Haliotis rufescens]